MCAPTFLFPTEALQCCACPSRSLKYKAGFIDKTLHSSDFIERKYRLVPENTNFDVDNILKRYQQGAIYKAKIQSNLCKLNKVNSIKLVWADTTSIGSRAIY